MYGARVEDARRRRTLVLAVLLGVRALAGLTVPLPSSLRMADANVPRRIARTSSGHDALQVLVDETWRGRRWVVETDVADCFSAIPHDRLMQAVEERVMDRPVLKLLRAMLRAGVIGIRRGHASGDRHPAGQL